MQYLDLSLLGRTEITGSVRIFSSLHVFRGVKYILLLLMKKKNPNLF